MTDPTLTPDATDKMSVASVSIIDKIHSVPVSLIDASGRLRPVNAAQVQVIKDSIVSFRRNSQEGGLPAPITIRPVTGGSYKLVAGAHRLQAVIDLGEEAIDAIIRPMNDLQARLLEIDENLCRAELTSLDRASFLAERDRVWKEINPLLGKGKAGAIARWHHATENFSFASDISERVGLSGRSIRNDVKLFQELAKTPDVIDQLRGTWLEDHQGQLKALAKLGPDERRRAIALMLRGEAPAANVAAAVAELQGHRKVESSDDDKHFQGLLEKWKRAPAKAKARFLDHLYSEGALQAYIDGPDSDEEAA